VLCLAVAPEFLKLLVTKDAAEQDDTGPLKVLPVKRPRYLDCTDVRHGNHALLVRIRMLPDSWAPRVADQSDLPSVGHSQ
jgi:hypothetical protein